MPDLLTHVLVAYVLSTVLSLRYDWLSPTFVIVAMLGAIVPDLTKSKLIVPHTVEAWLGLPFDWFAVHTLGGALVAVTIGALATTDDHRGHAFALLLAGALSHRRLDGMLVEASGYATPLPLAGHADPTADARPVPQQRPLARTRRRDGRWTTLVRRSPVRGTNSGRAARLADRSDAVRDPKLTGFTRPWAPAEPLVPPGSRLDRGSVPMIATTVDGTKRGAYSTGH